MKHFVIFMLMAIFTLYANAEEDVRIVAQLDETKGEFVINVTNETPYDAMILNFVSGNMYGSFLMITEYTKENKSYTSYFQLWESSKRYDLKELPIGKSISFTISQKRITGSINKLKQAQVVVEILYTNPSTGKILGKCYKKDFKITK